ncbi:MAG: hypothetical protein AB7G75_25675, partial [Candidatus Binatia bacterium]
MNEKITPEHLTRAAYVYVRQSSGHQVQYHRESLLRQYALADRAQQLGFAQVVVIDDDLLKVDRMTDVLTLPAAIGAVQPPGVDGSPFVLLAGRCGAVG